MEEGDNERNKMTDSKKKSKKLSKMCIILISLLLILIVALVIVIPVQYFVILPQPVPCKDCSTSGCKCPLRTIPDAKMSYNGNVATTYLTLDKYLYKGPSFSQYTRAYNNSQPGHTIYVNKTIKVLEVQLTNNLKDNDAACKTNTAANGFHCFNKTNLHTHGLHVSQNEDNALLSLKPGQTHKYVYNIASNHMPGTHWYHPHKHGSTFMQVGGGAVGMLIIDDDTKQKQYEEIRLVIHQLRLSRLLQYVQTNPVIKLVSGKLPINYLSVNGQYQPVITMKKDKQYRWRLLLAGYDEGGNVGGNQYLFKINNCEINLIALDGVYISDNPRKINEIVLGLGSRADVLIKCTASTTMIDTGTVLHINVVITSESNSLIKYNITYPGQITSLLNINTGVVNKQQKFGGAGSQKGLTFGASGGTKTPFNPNKPLDTLKLNTIYQILFESNVNNHPMHQHTQHMQVQSDSQYSMIKKGDWVDTAYINSLVRLKPMDQTGTLMFHCHKLKHEDNGMMGTVNIIN